MVISTYFNNLYLDAEKEKEFCDSIANFVRSKITEYSKEIPDAAMDTCIADMEIHTTGSILDAFCENEAAYRLQENHGILDETKLKELTPEAADVIRECIEKNELLYDSIDNAVEYVVSESEKEL